MNGGISEQGRAVPPWLLLGDEEAALSAGLARGVNVALALVLAIAGVWLIASAGDASEAQAPAGVAARDAELAPDPKQGNPKDPEPAPATDPGPKEYGSKMAAVTGPDPDRPVGESATGERPPAAADDAGGPAIRAPGSPGKLDPKAAESLAQRGEQALKSGKRSSAKKLFEEALALDPDNTAALMGLSNLSFDAGNYASAERYARQAVQLAPRNADYQLRLGDAYLKLGQTARARTHYQRAQKLGHPFAAARLTRLPKG